MTDSLTVKLSTLLKFMLTQLPSCARHKDSQVVLLHQKGTLENTCHCLHLASAQVFQNIIFHHDVAVDFALLTVLILGAIAMYITIFCGHDSDRT